MTATQATSQRKRYLKILLIGVAIPAFIILGLHIWFVNNARGVLKEIVTTKSRGKIKLELSQLSFNFFSNKLQVRQADLVSTDSLHQVTTYRIKFRKLTLRVASFWPLILQKRLLLDSIKLHDPEVQVMLWRKDTSSKGARDELSLTQEMGKLYNSMLDVLDGFGIRRIIINNAKLSLVNKMKPGSEPVTVSHIFFDLLRTGAAGKKRDQFVKDEQSVELETSHQNIALPGGRHRLAFKKFHLELFSKRIQLDSCTVTALATDSSKSSYSIFFKKLMLIGVDFNAMYRFNLIKADSVYCENPLFNIEINTTDAVKKKQRPDPEKIIRELTGNLDLAFVGVQNAGIHINIIGKKKRSLFNSNKDDFEMRGLRINADSSKPVVVKRFDMLVQDYRLYNEDSSSAYTFDSIHFVNNKIVLNNFLVVTSATGANKMHNKKDFRIPYFELTGLDWYQLIFEENLRAKEAVLYHPVITYFKTRSTVSKKKTNLFAALQNLDSLVALNKMDIINGQVNVVLGNAASFQLKSVNLSVYTNTALQSTNREGLRRAIDHFSFVDGFLQIKEVSAHLKNVRYTGANLLEADKLLINSKGGNLKADISHVLIDNFLLDEKTETVELNGLRWNGAILSLPATTAGKSKGGATFKMKNIEGKNTLVNFKSGQLSVATFLPSLQLASLYKQAGQPVVINGLVLNGSRLAIKKEGLQLATGEYKIVSESDSYFKDVIISDVHDRDSIFVRAPKFIFSADFNALLSNNLHFKRVQLQSPVVDIAKWTKVSGEQTNSKPFALQIDNLSAEQPELSFRAFAKDSFTTIKFYPSPAGNISLKNLLISGEGLQLDGLTANTEAATFTKSNGDVVGVEKGIVKIDIAHVRLSKNDTTPAWSGLINNLYLQNPNSLTLGRNKNKLMMNEVSVGNLQLSSDYISDFSQLLKYNVSAWLRSATGEYADSNKVFKWYNAEYNYVNGALSLDSFSYAPAKSREEVMANTPYQKDFITFKSGPVKLTEFNLEKYKADTALIANTVTITQPLITIYRDKQPPLLKGIIKALPVDLIKKIYLPIAVKQINLVDGSLLYTEKHGKTRAEGTLLLSHLNGSLADVKNRALSPEDSLTLNVTAYLMDSALLTLKVKESYADSLSGFLMSLRMKPTSLSFLNPVIAPLSNVIITSGTIDSLYLNAVGHDKFSFGEMHMYYHGLRIKVVKDGVQTRSGFVSGLATFLANNFIIKRNNNGRKGLVYFERLRDRSFFNYIVKMTFSGMATSVGIKKNKAYQKKYQQKLEESKLPALHFK